ncbi:MAG: hypothetical protein R3C05_17385 [Pirellulaceae bacterium]
MIRFCVFCILLFLATVATAQEPIGRWSGGWRSNTSGHRGPMRATITPRSDGRYDARFSGRFALIIPFTYRVTMTPVAVSPCGTTLVATKKMPIFGTYRMTATVSGNSLDARYTAKKDVGVFRMRRSR